MGEAPEKISILVADDNREFCNVIMEFIENQPDMRIAGVATNGVEACEMIEELLPDVVILDIIMPHLDGIGVLERLNCMRHLKKRPKVLMFTAIGYDHITQKIVELGADYYIMKPFDMETMAQRIRQLTASNFSTGEAYSLANAKSNGKEDSFDLSAEVTRLLHGMGIPANIKGYQYVREAIIMVTGEIQLLGNVTKTLYPNLAAKFKTTPSRVERAIRHAIEVAWNKGDIEFIEKIFDHTVDKNKGKPSNSAFIARVAERLRLELKRRPGDKTG